MSLSQKIIQYLLKNPPKSEADVLRAKRKFCKTSNTKNSPTNSELLQVVKEIKQNRNTDQLALLLRKRHIRTLSGIAAISVLTKSYPCPGTCAYCPNESKMPKSYLSNEPAVMRAILCKFNPYKQVQMRLRALQNNGHQTDKIELIVMGGTWSYLPQKYQIQYLTECYKAANDFPQKHKKRKNTENTKTLSSILKKEQKRNEKAKNRIVGLTLETRPDYITPEELTRMREYGCTRIEIGVQHIDDNILKLNKRGHESKETINATKLMREFGFKITYHIMLNLPGSTPAKDFKMCQTIFADPRFGPDQIKLYPCVVSHGALLHRWWKQKKWKPYSTKTLINLLVKIKSITPEWVRIIRVIRDIPEESIIAGNKITNLRQTVQQTMKNKNLSCKCIRCREAGHIVQKIKKSRNQEIKLSNKIKLKIRKYKVSNGTEYFLSYESKNKKTLYAFCRLYLPNINNNKLTNCKVGSDPKNESTVTSCAMIRELHTYGQMTPIGQSGQIQHQGLGKKLLLEAEKIAQKNNFSQISVISGIGVRQYYRKQGYRLQQTYMVKTF